MITGIRMLAGTPSPISHAQLHAGDEYVLPAKSALRTLPVSTANSLAAIRAARMALMEGIASGEEAGGGL